MRIRWPTFDEILEFLKKLKPIIFGTWQGRIAGALIILGGALIAPGGLSYLPFIWCLFSHWELPSSELYATCPWPNPDEILSSNPISIGVGIFLICAALFIIWLNRSTKKAPPGFDFNIPSQGISFKQIVESAAGRRNKIVKLVGLSEKEYEELYIDGNKGQIRRQRTLTEFVLALISKLGPHPFTSISAEEQERVLIIKAE